MEHVLNVYAARAARGAVAEFLGYCEVERGQATAKLTEGVWLVPLLILTCGCAVCNYFI